MAQGRNTSSFGVSVDLAGLDAWVDEKQAACFAAARPASQAGAEVLYRAYVGNLQALGRVTGNMLRSAYQVFSKDNSAEGRAVYHVSWNHKIAPHGHLVEWGHLQRYAVHRAPDGNFYTLVRAGMRGKPKPKRNAPQSVKDAYYVTLPQPRQVAAQAPLRKTMSQFDAAEAAMRAEFFERVGAK